MSDAPSEASARRSEPLDTGSPASGASDAPSEASARRSEQSDPASDPWGRVDEQGTVFLRTATGERVVGSWKAGSAADALAYFHRKYEGLAIEIDLLERRIRTTDLSPKEALASIQRHKAQVADAHAIGDLDALSRRLDALVDVVDARRAEIKSAKAQALDVARGTKEQIVAEAEQLAQSSEWRSAGERLRGLVEEWKAAPRLDRKTDDELWHRFSAARSAFAKRRKAHFATMDDQREEARLRKERLAVEAESLATSREWGPTAARFRELMNSWRAAGRAHRNIEDELWNRFRAAQDMFFQARSEVFSERDSEQQENQVRKEALIAEAEALLPITNVRSARAVMRSINERWETIGHVPREVRPRMESRLHAVERAIHEVEESEWRRTNPEARARTEATVAQLRRSITQLEEQAAKARAAGQDKKADEAENALNVRREWLTEAERTLEEFSR